MSTRGVGLAFGFAAYGSWGLLPLFWRQLAHVPPLALVFHRVLWAFVVLLVIVLAARQLGELRRVFQNRRAIPPLLLASLLVATNWFCFVYGVATERVIQVSLGYFINPLLSVLLGTLVLRERLRALQWLGVGASAVAVAFMTVRLGELPWLSVLLAVSFALYGLVRKTSRTAALPGTAAETMVLAPLCLAAVVYSEATGPGYLTSASAPQVALLLCTGFATALPLLFFANAARRLPLSTVGFLQYLAPSLHLVVAVLVFGEAFTPAHGVTFGLIWAGIALFVADGVRQGRRPRRVPGAQAAEV